MEIAIRPERPGDCTAIRQVLLSAFPTEQEAHLIDRLRRNGRLMISLVAEPAREIVGQIAFSAVSAAWCAMRRSSTNFEPEKAKTVAREAQPNRR
jgi:predicted N-acetyltransferase YhbS